MYTCSLFTPLYKDIIINKRDKSFYDKNYNSKNIPKEKRPDSNFRFLIRKYTEGYSDIINNYLKTGNCEEDKKEIESFIYCLHSLLVLREGYYVQNGTVVYKGIYFQIPNNWTVGTKFYIGEFVSTTLNKNIAKLNSKGKILSIKIKNNGANGQVFYCRNIQRISYYPMEQEILITAFSKFLYIREDDDMIYLKCLGY
jgi:hypothetical protein